MTTLKLRILFDDAMFGPGKAALLGHIQTSGSISAAGRAMGMSYKRAWTLVEEMNAAFRAPLVLSTRGGRGVGGAQLTETGIAVLGQYRRALERASAAAAPQIAEMEALLRVATKVDMSERK